MQHLTDKKATPQTQALFRRLIDGQGRETLSGVQSFADLRLVRELTGNTPAIIGGDLMDFTPSRRARGADPEDLIAKLIAQAEQGSIVTLCWHWNAPSKLIDKVLTGGDGKEVNARWYRGFMTNATTFDLEATLDDPGSDDYRLLMADIDAIAEALQPLADRRIPVLFRPLHEADGRWFWWGAKGAGAYKRLWALVRSRLEAGHQLHNLIWVYTGTADLEWYPADDQFDVIGVDAYPPDKADPLDAIWTAINAKYAGQKLIALTEFGGVPDLKRMRERGVYFSYFVSWTGDLGPAGLAPGELKRLYRADGISNRKATDRQPANRKPKP